ncbi:hypothetical protein DERF_001978 [Dermatophagoides farinae]|uniref:Uncharacterized protein n=1 Tax=Dermatophagoides farinae TaxID=6954 RepID=A0A922IFV7_DERFA|nr:hypothetical protein DERF_001978 [Dermatophagoides farinae]
MMDNINSWLFCPSQLEQEKMTYSHCVGYDDDDDNDDNDCFRLKLAIHLCPSDATQSKNVFSSHYLFTCRWKTTTKMYMHNNNNIPPQAKYISKTVGCF